MGHSLIAVFNDSLCSRDTWLAVLVWSILTMAFTVPAPTIAPTPLFGHASLVSKKKVNLQTSAACLRSGRATKVAPRSCLHSVGEHNGNSLPDAQFLSISVTWNVALIQWSLSERLKAGQENSNLLSICSYGKWRHVIHNPLHWSSFWRECSSQFWTEFLKVLHKLPRWMLETITQDEDRILCLGKRIVFQSRFWAFEQKNHVWHSLAHTFNVSINIRTTFSWQDHVPFCSLLINWEQKSAAHL